MALRPLLSHLLDDPDGAALAHGGGRAFVSLSMRAYLVAALADARTAPAIVVAGDDRQARDLAADLRQWLAPRPVRLYPTRGVAYESHLTPPPHLVGLRVAALDALLADPADGEEAPVVVVSAVALSEKVPARSPCGSGTWSTLTRWPRISSRRATSASSRSTIAGSSRCAAA
jgi:transcription-repair coupling factor (superfamily II helicase)